MGCEYLALYAADYELLLSIWQALLGDRLTGALFYDGKINNSGKFAACMMQPGLLPFAVFCKGKFAMFTWLNCINGKTARAHFAVMREFWGDRLRLPLGRFAYRHILNLQDGHGYLFDCLYGVTPKTHRLALRAVLRCGWVLCGEIPDACYIARLNRHVNGIVTCLTRQMTGSMEGRE